MKRKKKKYQIMHEHEHGTSFYFFQTDLEIQELPDDIDLAKLVECDYEEWDGESTDGFVESFEVRQVCDNDFIDIDGLELCDFCKTPYARGELAHDKTDAALLICDVCRKEKKE
jgi:hypothetical protein